MKNKTSIEIFKNLFASILDILEGEYITTEKEGLEKLFFKYFDEIMEIAFDVNLDIDALEEFDKNYRNSPDFSNMAEFVINTVENEKTYTILNYYIYRFIQNTIPYTKKASLNKLESILENRGLKESDIDSIEKNYKNLVLDLK